MRYIHRRAIWGTLFFFILLSVSLYSKEDIDVAMCRAYLFEYAQKQEGFVADTAVSTKDGSQAIDSLRDNDEILNINLQTSQLVILNESRFVAYLYEICVGDSVIYAAASQQFFDTRTCQWVKAQDLDEQHVLGAQQVKSVQKIIKFRPVYKLTTQNHEFILDNGLIRVHNATIAQVCDMTLTIGSCIVQHPVIKALRYTVSLAKLAYSLYQAYEQVKAISLQESLSNDDVLYETRYYYQSRRIELLNLLQEYQNLQQAVFTVTKQSSISYILFVKSQIVGQSKLLPKQDTELSYSLQDRQKLLELREQELRTIEKEIEAIQISLVLQLQEQYDSLVTADGELAIMLQDYQPLLSAQLTRANAYKKCEISIMMLEALEYLEKMYGELSLLIQFYKHPHNAKQLKQSSTIEELCMQAEAHLSKINSVSAKMRSYIVSMQQAIYSSATANGLVSSWNINSIRQQVYAQRQEKEKEKQRNVKIKQTSSTYAPPPNDPDLEDKNKKYTYKTHPHDDKSNHFPTKERPHGLRNDEGHIPDTPENRQKILDLARNRNNRIALDRHGNMWYAKAEQDGSQLWASARTESSEIQNCGLNLQPRSADPETGLCANISKQQRTK